MVKEKRRKRRRRRKKNDGIDDYTMRAVRVVNREKKKRIIDGAIYVRWLDILNKKKNLNKDIKIKNFVFIDKEKMMSVGNFFENKINENESLEKYIFKI